MTSGLVPLIGQSKANNEHICTKLAEDIIFLHRNLFLETNSQSSLKEMASSNEKRCIMNKIRISQNQTVKKYDKTICKKLFSNLRLKVIPARWW